MSVTKGKGGNVEPFNYYRNIRPLPTVSVPLIPRPLKLPRHTVDMVRWSPVNFPYKVSERQLLKGLWRYCVRTHNGARIVSPRHPPQLLN